MKNEKKSVGKKAHGDKGMAIFDVKENAELMKFLIASLPGKNRNNIKSLLANKQVFVDGKYIKQFNHPLVPGQTVEIRWSRVPEEKQYRGISIVHEDDDIIVIDKHAGMLSIALDNRLTETAFRMLSDHVKKQNPSNRIFVVHRLDRDTSGLMMFAKSEEIKNKLQENWTDVVLERTYVALVEGVVEETEGEITSYLFESKAMIVYSSQDPKAGEKAITTFKLMKAGKKYSLLLIQLKTGKKNQIRVHMKDIGHPVAGDKKYGAVSSPIGRLGLHAMVLSFIHPVSNEVMTFKTPVPRKFMRVF